MLESREPDAVQVETPDDHLGVVSGRREDGRTRERKEKEEGEGWVTESMDRRNSSISNWRGVWVIMSSGGVTLLTLIIVNGRRRQRSW